MVRASREGNGKSKTNVLGNDKSIPRRATPTWGNSCQQCGKEELLCLRQILLAPRWSEYIVQWIQHDAYSVLFTRLTVFVSSSPHLKSYEIDVLLQLRRWTSEGQRHGVKEKSVLQGATAYGYWMRWLLNVFSHGE